MYMYPILHNQFKMNLELCLEKLSKPSKEKRGESFRVSVKVGEWQDRKSRRWQCVQVAQSTVSRVVYLEKKVLYERWCNKHQCTHLLVHGKGSPRYAAWSCWVIMYANAQLSKIMSDCFPKWPCQFTPPLAILQRSCRSTSSQMFGIVRTLNLYQMGIKWYFCIFVLFCFWLHPWHMEAPWARDRTRATAVTTLDP